MDMKTLHPADRSARSADVDGRPAARPAVRPRRRGAALAGLAGALALGLGTLTASPAWAHDELISATPESGEILTEVPDRVELEFSGDGLTAGEGIANEIRVTGPEGERWDGETEIDGSVMSTELDDGLPGGQYEVRYRAVYSDGHQAEDTYTFAVSGGAASASADGEDADGEDADDDGAGEAGASEAQSSDAAAEDQASPGPTAAASDAVETPEAATDEDAVQAADQDADQEPLGASLPSWAPAAFGAGALAVVILGIVLVRRKITQVDQWKRDSEDDRD